MGKDRRCQPAVRPVILCLLPWPWVLRNPPDPAYALGGGTPKHSTTLPGGLWAPSSYPGDGEAIPPVLGEPMSVLVRGRSRMSNMKLLLLSFAL